MFESGAYWAAELLYILLSHETFSLVFNEWSLRAFLIPCAGHKSSAIWGFGPCKVQSCRICLGGGGLGEEGWLRTDAGPLGQGLSVR